MPKTTPQLAQQHPVPQHIAAFEFKLIGDLTLKQFLFAGVGVAIAYAAWISHLNFLTKWLTIILAGGIGLGVAFFPIQDRTLDQWLLNLVGAILSPTQRIWRKEPLPPEFLREDYSQFLTSQVLSMTPLQSRHKLQQYLRGLEEGEKSQSEIAEQEFIGKLNFDIPIRTELPKADERERKIEDRTTEDRKWKMEDGTGEERIVEKEKPLEKMEIIPGPGYQIPLRRNITPGRKVRLPVIEGTIQLKPLSYVQVRRDLRPLPERKILPPKSKEPIKQLISETKKTPPFPSSPPTPPAPPTLALKDGRVEQLQKQNLELQTRLGEAEQQLKGLLELKQELSAQEAYHQRLLEQERLVQKLTARQKTAQKEISEIKGVPTEEPTPSEEVGPNTITGVVRDREGKLLENMVVIIKDQDGDPVRALKTNRLGRFAITTPLENGDYTAEVSSQTQKFAIIKIKADGSVLPTLTFDEKND
jgi:hypothetical protein